MFKQAFRVAFITLIWKQYKSVIVSTAILFTYLLLVSWLHSDYIASAQLEKQTTGLSKSFAIKWIAFAGGIGLYFLYHGIRRQMSKSRPKDKAVLMPRVADPNATKNIVNDAELATDPFAHIRTRKKLRGRKDFEE